MSRPPTIGVPLTLLRINYRDPGNAPQRPFPDVGTCVVWPWAVLEAPAKADRGS